MTNTEELSSIATKVKEISTQIQYVEDYLQSTTSPADHLILELNILKDVREFYINQLAAKNEH